MENHIAALGRPLQYVGRSGQLGLDHAVPLGVGQAGAAAGADQDADFSAEVGQGRSQGPTDEPGGSRDQGDHGVSSWYFIFGR